MRRHFWRFPCAATILVVPAQSHASDGFYLDAQSAKAAGRAYSGEVADRGASALWWNPAAIAGQARPDAQISLALILPNSEVVDRQTLIARPFQPPAPVGGNPIARDALRRGVLPTMALAWPVTPRLALGVAVTSPYSFTTQYADDSWVRYSAMRTHLRTIDVQPSLAYAPTDWLRLGVGLNVEQVNATLSNKLPNLSPLDPDGTQRLTGDGIDIGYNIGAQLQRGPVTLGLAYRSSVEHRLTGEVTIDGLTGPLAGQNGRVDHVRATFRTPWQWTAGARVTATPRLTLNVQAVRLGWAQFDQIRLSGPLTAAIPQKYRNSWSVSIGGDYLVRDGLTLRAGVQHNSTPTQDGQRDARVPDGDRWNLAAGGSARITRGVTLDAAVNYLRFGRASIDRPTAAYVGSPVQTAILTDGHTRNTHVFVLALGARIGL